MLAQDQGDNAKEKGSRNEFTAPGRLCARYACDARLVRIIASAWVQTVAWEVSWVKPAQTLHADALQLAKPQRQVSLVSIGKALN